MYSHIGIGVSIVYVDEVLGLSDTDVEGVIIHSVPDSKLDFSANLFTIISRFTVQTAQIIKTLFTSSLTDQLEARVWSINVRRTLGISRCITFQTSSPLSSFKRCSQ